MAPGQKQDYSTGEILRKWQGVTIGYCISMYGIMRILLVYVNIM
jgi:hypothetical protein